MRAILKLEEAAMFLLSVFLFNQLDYAWWLYPALLLAPDISMLGYAVNARVGAAAYNLFHHKGVAILLYISGLVWALPVLTITGIIMFGHASMDRVFGYGLKYANDFKNTHLGIIGKQA